MSLLHQSKSANGQRCWPTLVLAVSILRSHRGLEIKVKWRHTIMHRAVFFLSVLILVCPAAVSQNHGEVGVFANYFRFHNANDLNMLGVGGRLSVNVHPHVVLEAEGAYDFEQTAHITVRGLTNTDLNGVFYPAGGVEAFAGILGFRAEIGDEMYFANGANHNLRITFGPAIRF